MSESLILSKFMCSHNCSDYEQRIPRLSSVSEDKWAVYLNIVNNLPSFHDISLSSFWKSRQAFAKTQPDCSGSFGDRVQFSWCWTQFLQTWTSANPTTWLYVIGKYEDVGCPNEFECALSVCQWIFVCWDGDKLFYCRFLCNLNISPPTAQFVNMNKASMQ